MLDFVRNTQEVVIGLVEKDAVVENIGNILTISNEEMTIVFNENEMTISDSEYIGINITDDCFVGDLRKRVAECIDSKIEGIREEIKVMEDAMGDCEGLISELKTKLVNNKRKAWEAESMTDRERKVIFGKVLKERLENARQTRDYFIRDINKQNEKLERLS